MLLSSNFNRSAMKRSKGYFFPFLFAFFLCGMFACKDDAEDTVTRYLKWNKQNMAYFENAKTLTDENGSLYYEEVCPNWDTTSCVLMHHYTYGESTETPYYTSFIKVCYRGELIDGTGFDSTHVSSTNPMEAKLSSLVDGWAAALEKMHPGDSCRVVIPQNLGYGASSSGAIKPYSTLIFDIKLLEITRQ